MSDRYVIVARKHAGTIDFVELGAKATVTYKAHSAKVSGREAGSALWAAMKSDDVNPQGVNSFTVLQGGEDGLTVAYIHAVLEGARIVWLILYRADRAASCFKPLGSRQRIPDALDACMQQVVEDIELPHKP